MNLAKIKEIVIPILNRFELKLYSIKRKKAFNMFILEILVYGKNADVSLLAKVNRIINDEIDEELPHDYNLEVSSAGAERKIRSLEEAADNIGKFVFIKTSNEELFATLVAVKDSVIVVEKPLKNKSEVVNIAYKDIKTFRLAIRL